MNNIKYVLFFFSILAFSSNAIFAQQAATTFSLADCISFAKENSQRLKNAKLDEQLQLEKNNEIIGIARPQVKATAQFQYLFVLPTSRADANAFNFASSLSFFKIDTPAFIAFQQLPKEKYTELQFGLPLNVSAGIQASQIVFDAGVLVALKARQSLEELSVLNTKRTEEDLHVNISKAYYNCIIAEKRVSLLDENIKLLSSIENTTSKLYKEGFVEKIDVDRLNVQLNNLKIEKQKIENLIALSVQVLKFQMGMPLDKNLKLIDNLNIEEVKNGLELDEVIDYNKRIEMSLLQTAKKLNSYELERQNKSYLPTIVAAVSGQYATQTKAFTELFTLPYFPTGALVLSASVPIYDGNARKAKVKQAKIALMKNENDMEALKQAIDFENSNARTQLKNSLISLENQKSNIELAEKVYKVAQAKYKEGVGSNIEIIQAETALKDAQTNYFNSLYETIISKIDFQKSLGQYK